MTHRHDRTLQARGLARIEGEDGTDHADYERAGYVTAMEEANKGYGPWRAPAYGKAGGEASEPPAFPGGHAIRGPPVLN